MHGFPPGRRSALAAVAALLLLPAALGTTRAHAVRAQSVANEARWVSFDPEARTVTVEILTKCKGNKALAKKFKRTLKRGRQVTVHVTPEGPIRSRTSVAIQGRMAGLADVEAGERIVLHSIEDPDRAGELFARKIDVFLSFDELRKRYEAERTGE